MRGWIGVSGWVVAAIAASAAVLWALGAAAQLPRPGEPMEIVWEDLMPPGEEDVLAQLYTEFFAELESQFGQSAGPDTPLAAAGAPDTGGVTAIEEGSALDQMVQIGTFNVVEDLNGELIRMPGYIVPFDFSAEAKHGEFLLVPYFGACIHTPPPPPNQIVYVKADPPAQFENIWAPVWIEGVMSTERNMNDLGNAAYTVTLTKVEPYEY